MSDPLPTLAEMAKIDQAIRAADDELDNLIALMTNHPHEPTCPPGCVGVPAMLHFGALPQGMRYLVAFRAIARAAGYRSPEINVEDFLGAFQNVDNTEKLSPTVASKISVRQLGEALFGGDMNDITDRAFEVAQAQDKEALDQAAAVASQASGPDQLRMFAEALNRAGEELIDEFRRQTVDITEDHVTGFGMGVQASAAMAFMMAKLLERKPSA